MVLGHKTVEKTTLSQKIQVFVEESNEKSRVSLLPSIYGHQMAFHQINNTLWSKVDA
jgi:hypothetical protein